MRKKKAETGEICEKCKVKMKVIDQSRVLFVEDSIFCFMPHINIFDFNIEVKDFHEYILTEIRKLTEIARKSEAKYKYFFGHFATDKSIAGQSFDMGMDEKSNRVLPLDIFDKSVWTRVYLGDIHKQQELNSFCRHIGSIAKVDFGEEGEKKGFYYVQNDEDTFIEINDRDFRTLFLNLVGSNPREVMGQFCEQIQEIDFSETIVRLKIAMKDSDRKNIDFKGLEDFLREVCWNYIGKSFQFVKEDQKEITIQRNEELNYMTMFKNYVKQLGVEDKEEVLQEGEKILFDALNL